MLIEWLNKKLLKSLKTLKASSCTFYLRDPHWIDEYRLVAMAGVMHDESMYGFTSPEHARKLLIEGASEIHRTVQPRNNGTAEPAEVAAVRQEIRQLFVRFSEREGVKSHARFIHTDASGEPEAILFVNYPHSDLSDETVRPKQRELFDELTGMLPRIRQSLIRQDAEWLGQATKVASPVWSATNIDYSLIGDADKYFNDVIGAVLRALDVAEGTGLGTIYLYDAADHKLELRGSFGAIEDDTYIKTRVVDLKQGVVTWVATMCQSLLIRDLSNSPYRDLHISLNDAVKCEIAVPLQVMGELIGVMCLECTEANKFRPHHVRALWYAANQVAVAYLLHRQASINRKLLELSIRATLGVTQANELLDNVAELFKEHLNASHCDIWCLDEKSDGINRWGASYKDFLPQHRAQGWTNYVIHTGYPLWINGIRSVTEFFPHHWKDGAWQKGTPDEAPPPELNSTPIQQGIKSELAIPIMVQDRCVGVAWIKYRNYGLASPRRDLMELALGFAAEAGLVLELVLRRGLLDEKARIDQVGEDIATVMRDKWREEKTDILDAYVRSEPFHSKLGGDYFARKNIDRGTTGILLVDAQGHGVEGSLHMLPIMTAFESSWNSYSAVHVISRLIKASKEVGVRGTAIYCVISIIQENRWLCVTSAGHEGLLLFTKKDRFWTFERFPDLATSGSFLNSPLTEPLMDQRRLIPSETIIVGFTDGVVEGPDEVFNLAVHSLSLVNNFNSDPEKIATGIMSWARSQKPEGFHDDATLFVARVK